MRNFKGYLSKKSLPNKERIDKKILLNTIPSEIFEHVWAQHDRDIGTYLIAYNKENDVRYMYKAKKDISFERIKKFGKKCYAYKSDFHYRMYENKEEITKEKILAEQKELFEDVFATDLELI